MSNGKCVIEPCFLIMSPWGCKRATYSPLENAHLLYPNLAHQDEGGFVNFIKIRLKKICNVEFLCYKLGFCKEGAQWRWDLSTTEQKFGRLVDHMPIMNTIAYFKYLIVQIYKFPFHSKYLSELGRVNNAKLGHLYAFLPLPLETHYMFAWRGGYTHTKMPVLKGSSVAQDKRNMV